MTQKGVAVCPVHPSTLRLQIRLEVIIQRFVQSARCLLQPGTQGTPF